MSDSVAGTASKAEDALERTQPSETWVMEMQHCMVVVGLLAGLAHTPSETASSLEGWYGINEVCPPIADEQMSTLLLCPAGTYPTKWTSKCYPFSRGQCLPILLKLAGTCHCIHTSLPHLPGAHNLPARWCGRDGVLMVPPRGDFRWALPFVSLPSACLSMW